MRQRTGYKTGQGEQSDVGSGASFPYQEGRATSPAQDSPPQATPVPVMETRARPAAPGAMSRPPPTACTLLGPAASIGADWCFSSRPEWFPLDYYFCPAVTKEGSVKPLFLGLQAIFAGFVVSRDMSAPFTTIDCFFSHLQRLKLKLITLLILSRANNSPPTPSC